MWLDTNCINKESSAELSEAINSMFSWYQRSVVCFVYLEDYHFRGGRISDEFAKSRWFTRGLMLQELLAPTNLLFYDSTWLPLRNKRSLCNLISTATSIPIIDLKNERSGGIQQTSVSMRTSWATNRQTTREEDIAYCLMGLFGIHMPLLYGEGEQTFIRLQEEIIKHSDDHTISCWEWPSGYYATGSPGILAIRPSCFRHGNLYVATRLVVKDMLTDFQLTNRSLRITLPILDNLCNGLKLAVLNVTTGPAKNVSQLACLNLEHPKDGGLVLVRSKKVPRSIIAISRSWTEDLILSPIYIFHTRMSVLRRFHTVVLNCHFFINADNCPCHFRHIITIHSLTSITIGDIYPLPSYHYFH